MNNDFLKPSIMNEDNIPLKKLELIGITPEVFKQLPQEFKDTLQKGEITPVICARKELENGLIIEMPMKLQSVTDDWGRQQLMVYPVLNELRNDMQLSPTSFENLKNGSVLHVDGQYIQRDPETNCILKVSDKDMEMEKKLRDVEKVLDIELGTEQKNQVRNGKPVELSVGGEQVVVGLDLKDPERFKTITGDMKDWEYQQKVIYDILHPEYVGVVKTEENRWEFQQIINSERFPESLKQKPMQSRNASMHR